VVSQAHSKIGPQWFTSYALCDYSERTSMAHSHKYRLSSCNEISTAALFDNIHHLPPSDMEMPDAISALAQSTATATRSYNETVPSTLRALNVKITRCSIDSNASYHTSTQYKSPTHTEADNPHVQTATIHSNHDRALRADKPDRRSRTRTYACLIVL
jgi:hypothetical protein